MAFEHTSVLLDEVLSGLAIKPEGIYVDGTLGGGGHASHVLERLSGEGRLIGIDQDADAIEAATKRLAVFQDKVTIVRSNYAQFREVMDSLGMNKVDGILLDLGVSSYQLDTPERGFSYREDALLDMRMDRRQVVTAKTIVNEYSEFELYRVIVKSAIPAKVRASGGHPAKRTFQAIRIELNHELEVLEDTIDTMIEYLNPGGRLCIITFHSLEDRIVKVKFHKSENPCTCPPDFPVCVCGRLSKGKHLTKKPVLPSEKELEENRRSKSAKLRIFQKG